VDQYLDCLRATDRFLTAEEVAIAEHEGGEAACRHWRRDTPLLAAAGADVMDRDADTFVALPFRAAHLKVELARVRELQLARDQAEQNLRRLGRALAYRQGRVASWTAQIEEITLLRLRGQAACGPAADRGRWLRQIALPLLGLFARSRGEGTSVSQAR
jgi:hypothetical protein